MWTEYWTANNDHIRLLLKTTNKEACGGIREQCIKLHDRRAGKSVALTKQWIHSNTCGFPPRMDIPLNQILGCEKYSEYRNASDGVLYETLNFAWGYSWLETCLRLSTPGFETAVFIDTNRVHYEIHTMRTFILPFLLPLPLLAPLIHCDSSPTATPIPSAQSTPKQIKIRECLNAPYDNLTVVPSAITTLETTLRALKTPILVSRNMGAQRFRASQNGTCVELLMQNWSCDHDLSLDGKSLAWAVESIASQSGPGDGKGYRVVGDIIRMIRGMIMGGILLVRQERWQGKKERKIGKRRFYNIWWRGARIFV
ncbi:uncharacterized protein BDR25DRAFT_351439 [Lindgomyces ingoldianus]|uniref:Uncharacterized protein n=1 Tax=Lindgomyces ingoldianus TaxID=673940 RepID=A0ACB6R6R2_9PLEO|nr:uncharacterized protein BDR25DRAFT_351439 [Lindgomyces ingoldianus]KAF2474958.1 hypothetical protein BDR25DRAFT_351439 [Lindgomyces ingoldianus]